MGTKLIDTINIDTLLSNGGIFKKIQTTQNQPFEWLTSDVALVLDKMLYLEFSGEKTISPFLRKLIELKDAEKINDELVVLASTLIQRFNDKWNKVYDAFIDSDYKPLENYSMLEVRTPNLTELETPNITKSRTEKQNTDLSTDTDNDIAQDTYGFNSGSAVPKDESHTDNLVHVTGDKDDNYVEISEGETGSRTKTNTGTERLERSGNIGVTTSQQMLESELKLRKDFNFVNMLLTDVSSVMCLSIYC